MHLYSNEKLVLIKQYIESESDDLYYDIFEERYDIIMVVDWREFDEDIIEYCEKILETNQLSIETVAANNKQGFSSTITYGDKQLLVPYQGAGADRDTTIITLNKILHPDYEIRWCVVSDGNDTLEFLPLPKKIWQALEEEYPDKLDALFQRIDENSILF